MEKTLLFKKSKSSKKFGFKHKIKGYNKNGAFIIQIKDKITKEKIIIQQGFSNPKTIENFLNFVDETTLYGYMDKFGKRNKKFNEFFHLEVA